MVSRADLVKDHAVISDQPEANRVYNKGQFGVPQSGGALLLDLVEAAYLAETGRVEVHRDDQHLSWPQVLAEATRLHPGFAIPYLVYRDLRSRGFVIRPVAGKQAQAGAHFHLWERGDPGRGPPQAWVHAATERGSFRLAPMLEYAAAAHAAGVEPRVAVVDEESDLTYYELETEAPKGATPPSGQPLAHGLLLDDRVLVADAAEAGRLHAREFYGRPVGPALQLSLVEALHLMSRDELAMLDAATGKPLSAAALDRRGRKIEPHLAQRLAVFADLKARGLVVKTGFKFGTHFRAYESGPEEGHAPYLVQAVPPDFESPWEPVARAVRLSHSVRKRLYLAAPGRTGVQYLSFGRHRP